MRLPIPTPLIVLAASALVANLVPGVGAPAPHVVEDIVTVALIAILWSGGRDIGLSRFRAAAAPIAAVGVAGTFLTVAGAAVFVHVAIGLSWYLALIVATAVAPTDPAVVFAVLGGREIKGRSGTILEGESGANDPVGIALMVSLLDAGAVNGSAAGQIAVTFLVQLAVGLAVGFVGGEGLRRVALRAASLYRLYPIVVILAVAVIFFAATLANGSGFLAVFVAGILTGDVEHVSRPVSDRLHAGLASLGEVVAFVVLGLTVDAHLLGRAGVFWPGLALAAVLAVVVRPAAAGLCLLAARLRRNELTFVLFAGLKGAVPLLLGQLVVGHGVPHAGRLYGIVVVVVVFSVLVQGSLTPPAARWLRIPVSE